MKKTKKRLDLLVQEMRPDLSRNQIQSFIMQGKVFVDEKIVNKAGVAVDVESSITVSAKEPKYVSRAGYKLEHALQAFGVDIKDKVALDAGISTGGFTNCLLQSGAKKVFGVDVGYGQVHEKIRVDSRVVLLERTNLRNLTLDKIGEPVDIVTLDLSFISVLKVMAAVVSVLKPGGILLVLIKPQFEAERHEVGRGGIIKDEKVHQAVIKKVCSGIEVCGFSCEGVVESPILGGAGNKEFLGLFYKGE
ncbi:TlyA family RNA methyltransferase [bacterium]|jgi:23S rRNA (cytidine1920-2'-O)/16S rRNA (cytidine1409-2'-O)-methyltransferase|nr:TlyA family RNA methyltransferase [bacterium]